MRFVWKKRAVVGVRAVDGRTLCAHLRREQKTPVWSSTQRDTCMYAEGRMDGRECRMTARFTNKNTHTHMHGKIKKTHVLEGLEEGGVVAGLGDGGEVQRAVPNLVVGGF